MRLYSGRAKPFLLPLDTITSNQEQMNAAKITRQLQVQGMFNQDFSNLRSQGLLPPGVKQPQLEFPSRGMGRQGGLSYETGGKIYISPETAFAATNPQSGLGAWGQETLVHELAHAMQNPRVLQSVPLREGGAQAYADAVSPRVIGPIPTRDTNYSAFVRSVRAKQGVPWFMRGQFQPNAAVAVGQGR